MEAGLVFVVLELCTNVVLEPLFYADAAGISALGLLIAMTFWAWLWGPIGLLIATPLTVCLVVTGKYVPGLEFLSTLIADNPELEHDVTYYQRLLAGDRIEAAEILTQYVESHDATTVYDALMIRAFNYAERDRVEGRLSVADEAALVTATSDLMTELGSAVSGDNAEPTHSDVPLSILGCPVEGEADTMALRMLARILPDPSALRIAAPAMLASDLIALVKAEGHRFICIADLPPSAPTKSRYLVKRLRAALPDVKIVVGRWGPASFADDAESALVAAGADAVTTQLVDSRDAFLQWQHDVERPHAAAVA